MRPRELRDRHTARPKSNEEREQLEEQIDGEKPAQVVREWHPEVASALLPDPLVLDGRGSWIKGQVPHDHDKGRNERNCNSQDNAGPAAVAWPAMTRRLGLRSVSFSGERTSAVTVWPLASAWSTTRRPVPPVAPRSTRFMGSAPSFHMSRS